MAKVVLVIAWWCGKTEMNEKCSCGHNLDLHYPADVQETAFYCMGDYNLPCFCVIVNGERVD